MGAIAAKASALVNISVLAKELCVDDYAYISESVPMPQKYSFEALCSEDADFLHLLEGLKINELNLN